MKHSFCYSLVVILFACLSVSHVEARAKKYELVICAHPDDELHGGHKMVSCHGEVGGHPFVDMRNENDLVSKCNLCEKAHPANPNLCQQKEVSCRSTEGPTHEDSGDGYDPKVTTIGR